MPVPEEKSSVNLAIFIIRDLEIENLRRCSTTRVMVEFNDVSSRREHACGIQERHVDVARDSRRRRQLLQDLAHPGAPVDGRGPAETDEQ